MSAELRRLSREVAKLLVANGQQLVLAESCTGGLIAATLAEIPGISNHLCGSAVTYQDATKHEWLGISKKTLENPGAVSAATADLMAKQVLAKTPHANLAASTTGHLGPQAPKNLDGIVYVAICQRQSSKKMHTEVQRHRLVESSRAKRQREAAAIALRCVRDILKATRQ